MHYDHSIRFIFEHNSLKKQTKPLSDGFPIKQIDIYLNIQSLFKTSDLFLCFDDQNICLGQPLGPTAAFKTQG